MNKKARTQMIDKAFKTIGIGATAFGLIVLFVLIFDVICDGAGRLSWDFLTSYPSRKPEQAGILSAWVGTLWIMITTGLLAIPVGIASGIYLEEYAPKNRLTDFIELNIANLAGVPSIIYGIMGLGLFVRGSAFGSKRPGRRHDPGLVDFTGHYPFYP